MSITLTLTEILAIFSTILTLGVYIGTFNFVFVKKADCVKNHDNVVTNIKDVQKEIAESIKRINGRKTKLLIR